MVTVRGQNQITLPVPVLQPLKAKTYYLVRTNGTAYIGMQGALHYKDIYQKYYKDLLYPILVTKSILNVQNWQFYHIHVVWIFSVDPTIDKVSYLLYSWKCEKSRILWQNCRNFQYCPDGPICHKTKYYESSQVFIVLGIYDFGYIAKIDATLVSN